MTMLFDETVHMDKDSEQKENCSSMSSVLSVVAVMLCMSIQDD